MALVTGTPYSTTTAQEEIYLDGAPTIYYQDNRADPYFNPDGDGYYWNLSGTPTYGVKELACITEVSFMQGVTANEVRCDTIGVKNTIQRRDYIDLQFSLQTFFPLSILAELANFSAADIGTATEKVGIGNFNNNQFWMVYAPKVYNDDVGDYLAIHLHKAQFVEPADWQMRYGEPWIQQFTVRAYADSAKPEAQKFGVIVRGDLSALP
jgi:hypothetical protein